MHDAGLVQPGCVGAAMAFLISPIGWRLALGRNLKQAWTLLAKVILPISLLLFAMSAATAETVNWNYPGANVNILAGSSNTTVNGVTVTTSAAASGGFSSNSAQITPAGSSNGSSVGIIQMAMDATIDNLTAFQTTTVTFSEPVYNLAFTVLDIDGGPTYTGQWNDVVDFNSNNGFPSGVVTNAAWVSYNAATGRATAISNQNAQSGNANQANGNIRVTYAGPVTSITIRHYAANANATTNPAVQLIYIDDFTFQRAPRLAVRKSYTGGTGSTTFNFNVSNSGAGTTATTVTTTGAAVTGTAIRLNATSTATTITETGPAGWQISPATSTCTDANSAASGNPASFAASVSGLVVTVPAVNIRPGAELTCAIINARLPTITLTKVSNGGVGGFTFNGDNGFGAAQAITTVTSGSGVAGATRTLAAVSTATTITETIPAGYALASATCTGMGTGGTATPNLGTGALVLNAAATAPGSNIACTFTNTRLPTVTLTKVSNGGTGGFTFTGTNGWASQTITTATAGTGVAGATQTLTSASTATTITETIPAGWQLVNVTCTGTGGGTQPTVNTATGAIDFTAAQTAPGSTIACTVTNARRPTVSVQKTTPGATSSPAAFSFTNSGLTGTFAAIATTSAGVAQPASPTPLVGTVGTAATITESAIVPGYAIAGVTCADANASVTGNTTPITSATTVVTIPAGNMVAGAQYNCVYTNNRRATVTYQKTTIGGFGGPFSFTGGGNLPVVPGNITTIAAGTPAPPSPSAITITALNTNTGLVETPASGYALTGFSCTDSNSALSGNPASGIGTLSGNTGIIPAANVVSGAVFNCVFTNTRLPTVTLTKVSNGGVGGFTFTGTNGWASQTITTVTSGTGVTGATQTLTAASTATTITEAIPAGWQLVGVTCTGTGGGTQPTVNTTTGAIDFTAAQTAPGSAIACTVTNARRPTITLTKVSNGGVGGFTFTGTNGWASQTITTVTAGTGVAGATQTLTAASTATTITETIPAGWQLVSVTCTGTGGGTQPTVNTTTGAIDFTAAQTAPGSAIACTVTNGFIAYTVAKSASAANVTAPGTITYTMTVTNTGGALLTGTTFSDSLAQGVTSKTLTTGPSFVSGDVANAGVFDPGEVWTYTATYSVSQADIDDGGTFANIFTFDTAQSSPQNSNSALTTVTRTPNQSVLKRIQTGTPTPLTAGQVITFEYVVTNTGNVTLSGVGIQETAFNGTGGTGALTPAGGSATLAPGASTIFTANYTVTQNDVDTLQ
jgi:uncharacterized repeat protein (TIGR01451 family)